MGSQGGALSVWRRTPHSALDTPTPHGHQSLAHRCAIPTPPLPSLPEAFSPPEFRIRDNHPLGVFASCEFPPGPGTKPVAGRYHHGALSLTTQGSPAGLAVHTRPTEDPAA